MDLRLNGKIYIDNKIRIRSDLLENCFQLSYFSNTKTLLSWREIFINCETRIIHIYMYMYKQHKRIIKRKECLLLILLYLNFN